MERNRSKKAKAFGASGKKMPLKNHKSDETVLVRCPLIPPARNFAKSRCETRRFVQVGAMASQGFSLANGHDQFLTVTNAATGAAVPYVDSWRIKKISVWCVSTGNFNVEANITPSGTDLTSNMRNDKEQIFEISSRSTAEPASMSIICSKDQPLGSWHFTSNVNTAGVLFIYNVQIGGGGSYYSTTMDIEFEVVDNLAGLPLGYGVVTSTLVLGAIGGRNWSNMSLRGVNSL